MSIFGDYDAPRLAGGDLRPGVGAKRTPSQVIARAESTRPGALITPAGFTAPLPNRSLARARGINPRTGPR